MRRTLKRNGWLIIKFMVAAVLCGLVLSQTRLVDLVNVSRQASLWWLVAGALSFYGSLLCMARRYWCLIDQRISYRETVILVAVQTAIGNVIATGAGAAAYVATLRAEYHVSVSRGVASLVWARVADLVSVWLGLIVSSAVLWEKIPSVHGLIILVGVVVGSGLGLLASMLWLQPRWWHRVKRLLARWHGLRRFSATLSRLDGVSWSVPPAVRGPVIGYTCLSFLLTVFFAYSLVRMFDVPVDGWAVTWVQSLTLLAVVIPVQILGGLGVVEVTALYFYGLVGAAHDTLAPALIAMRVVFYGLNLVLVAYWLLTARGRS